MVKKWQIMIDAHADVKTTDGYLLHLFCVGFTKKKKNAITRYARPPMCNTIRSAISERRWWAHPQVSQENLFHRFQTQLLQFEQGILCLCGELARLFKNRIVNVIDSQTVYPLPYLQLLNSAEANGWMWQYSNKALFFN